ncbi:hypothetical protein G4B88_022611 [Cannabis sativa]|uniref:Uncharacterized protein n=1 Tax=Cannabis sativa TaxID=3483 RepID=A0A7J6HXR7_CANSA|nr:hypothetical protein G4B88_022611 [Cannabis sativa]
MGLNPIGSVLQWLARSGDFEWRYGVLPISGLIGYDPVNDDHKLVRMVHHFYKDINCIHSFYTLRSKFIAYIYFNSWKRVGDFHINNFYKEFRELPLLDEDGGVDEQLDVDIWMMKEYGVDSSWTTKMFSLKPTNLYSKNGHQVLLHQDGETFLLHDLNTNKTMNMGNISGLPRSFDTRVHTTNVIV